LDRQEYALLDNHVYAVTHPGTPADVTVSFTITVDAYPGFEIKGSTVTSVRQQG
jgi:hypothetical protein